MSFDFPGSLCDRQIQTRCQTRVTLLTRFSYLLPTAREYLKSSFLARLAWKHSQQISESYDRYALVVLQLEEMSVTGHNQVGVGGNSTFQNAIVRSICEDIDSLARFVKVGSSAD